MLNFFRKIFFTSPTIAITPPNPSELLIQTLQSTIQLQQSEVAFLREQVKILTERSAPVPLPPRVVVPSRPMKFDSATQKFIPKTDEEIHQDRVGLSELGII